VSQIAQLAKEQSELVVTPELIKQNLFTVGMPPVDLVVRTGGEPHFSSGFMMWDVADAHLYFTETFYPDFSVEEFGKAIEEFESRERRLGK
jgi:undecaprenyl diphosphate synthase